MLVYKNTVDKEYEMTEKDPSLADMYRDTSCYTYKVTMLVQVLAPAREIANEKLNQDGGYVSKRDVEFLSSTLLYKDGLDEKTPEEDDAK